MFSKLNMFPILILSILFIYIGAKEEYNKKFLSKSSGDNSGNDQLPKKNHGLISLEEEPKVINIKCLFSKNYNFYSLQSLQDKEKDYEHKVDNYTFYYNFCQNTHKNKASTIVRVDSEGKQLKISGSIDGEGDDKNQWLELGDGDKKEGISVALTKGETCEEDTNSKYSANIIVHCDNEADTIKDFKIKKGNYSCVYTMEFTSRYGCPLGSTYLLLKLMEDYNYVFMVLMVLLGLFLCFVGLRFLAPTIIILCGIVGCYVLTALLLSLFPNFITTELYLFVCLLVCCILGVIVGYFTRDQPSFYVVLSGAFLGYSVATFLYQIVQNYVDWNPQILYYICIGVCVVIGAVIGHFLSTPILILGLSLFGGYLAMRGVSLVAGNYLDETMTIDLIKNREWDQSNELRTPWLYGYLGSWLALTIAGVILNCKYHRDQKIKEQGIHERKQPLNQK